MKRSLSKSVFTCVLTAGLAAGFAGAAFGQNVSPTINDFASRQFGQSQNAGPLSQQLTTGAANLVEGREINGGYALAFDKTATPPILYVSDTFNHRILAFKNPDNMKPCGINSAVPCGMADKVIGQRDFFSTQQGGVGRIGLNNGFAFPTSIAVDSNGNLYVLDSGNHRILRFPAPFKQTGSLPTTDLVIGQKTINSTNQPNEGMGNGQVADATSLYLGGGVGSLAINPTDGSLWVADYNNFRVLRFPASVLTPNNILPQADMVLGQLTMTANTYPTTCTQAQLGTNCLYLPSSLAFDAAGNLYVGDAYQRVLYFLAPNANGISANRILGLCEVIAPVTSANCSTTNQFAFGVAGGLFSDGTNLYVADAANHRIVKFDVPNNWPPGPTPGEQPPTHQHSPPIMAVFGQNTMQNGKVNKGQTEPDATTFQTPRGGAFNGTDLWVADTGNNRVLGFSVLNNTYSQATRLIGQVDYFFMQPNLIEGRELWLSTSLASGGTIIGGAVAIDHNSTPPHLYVADTLNHRILGFNDARTVKAGQRADLVIGQVDISGQPGSRFYRAQVNYPSNDPQVLTPTGLNLPSDVLVDPKDGSLWVADTGNGRVLRFPPPSFSSTTPLTPNLVLGQQDFNSQNTDPTVQTMASPRGLAFMSNGNALAVSDAALNRVLIFKRTASQDFSNGQSAASVLGQTNFNNRTPGNGQGSLNQPSHIAVDSSDRLYVADTGNNRLSIFTNTVNLQNGANASLLPAVNQPVGVIVSQATGESWVTLGNAFLWRLPEYVTLATQSNPSAPPYSQQIALADLPFAITLDNSNNLIVAEQANRITFYFPKLSYYHAASYNGGDTAGRYNQGMAPGQLMLLYQVGQNFNFQTNTENTDPWPLTMSDLQVTVNGTAAPIFRVDNIDIALQIPSNAPSSGTADFQVTHPSTGEVVAAGSIPMTQYNPGFFTSSSNGVGQVSARNDDNSINSPSNPIAAKGGTHFLSLYLTGGGVFDGGPNPPPKDGFAPTATANTHDIPQIGGADFGGFLPNSAVQYSGAGGFAGGYQVNFFVPETLAPGPHQIVVLLNGVPSNVGPNGAKIFTTFYTK